MQFTNYCPKRLVRINYPCEVCLPPEETARKAEMTVANPNQWSRFHILINNCEHFACWCKLGVKVSFQVVKKIRECIDNPVELIKYAIASSESKKK